MSVHIATGDYEVLYQEIVALIAKHAGHASAMEILAVASNLVGKLVAMQDQRKVTPDMAMEVVGRNIEYGNKQVREALANADFGAMN